MLLLLVLALLATPVLEIYLIIQVGGLIGAWPTVGLLLAESVLGGWIVRREGRRAWRALDETLRRGVVPDRELGDAALVMAGGVLLLVPGFVTDVVGFAFVLPFTRPLVRRAVSRYAARRMRIAEARARARAQAGAVFPPGFGGSPFDPFGRGADRDRVETPPGPVVRGEVVDEDDPSSRT